MAATRRSGREYNGKGEGEKTTLFKMADQLMAEIANLKNRPFHQAYLVKKLPCPHVHCTAQLVGAFFEETGLVQHYRAKHAVDYFRYYDEKIKSQARQGKYATRRMAVHLSPGRGLLSLLLYALLNLEYIMKS